MLAGPALPLCWLLECCKIEGGEYSLVFFLIIDQYSTGTVLVNKELLTGTLPVNKKLLTGTLPVNKELLTGTLPVINFYPSVYALIFMISSYRADILDSEN